MRSRRIRKPGRERHFAFLDFRGQEVVRFAGKKNPPKMMEWDGRKQDGTMALPGLTYSYVLEATDKAGNKRRFVGEGFHLKAYRRGSADGQEFLITGDQWRVAANEAHPGASAYLLETASWLKCDSAAITALTSAGDTRCSAAVSRISPS